MSVTDDLELRFEQHLLKAKKYTIKKMKGDGACLFRAVADQIYGDEDMHGQVRSLCMDYMIKNRDFYSQFVTEDFSGYIERKRQEQVHGNHVEMQSMAEMFNRPIHVFEYTIEPINTFQTHGGKDNPPIRVSYHNGQHYNSVVDPHAATIGVGLGLPQFHPGRADRDLLSGVAMASEKDAIEQQMLKDKLAVTDWEATDEQMNEQIARESYFQWLRDQEKICKERKNKATAPAQPSPRAHSTNSPAPSTTNARSAPASPESRQLSPGALAALECVSSIAVPASVTAACHNSGASTSAQTNWLAECGSLLQPAASTSQAIQAKDHGQSDDDLLRHILELSRQEFYDQNTQSQPGTSKKE